MEVMTWDAVASAIDKKKKARTFSLLLGNGFSMAFDPGIFSYNALNDFVRKQDNEVVAKLLEVVGVTDFERVMQHLDVLLKLCEIFDTGDGMRSQIVLAREALQRGLLEAVKDLHPEHVFKVPKEKCDACAAFLSPFLKTGGALFTTNYDLLLYWVLMRGALDSIDGFGRDREDDGDGHTPRDEQEWSEELFWGRNEGQNIFYLHGTLPLFDTGTEVVKETYKEHNYLLARVKQRMNLGHYPIFVTAGDGNQKLEHIRQNPYLFDAYSHLEKLDGSLVTFGFNFGPQDEHIIRAINIAAKQPKGSGRRLWSIYIGVYSDDDADRIHGMKDRFKCKVHMFDSKTAPVWREVRDA
ncbi:MAG TPA: DUF4917 family protein [Gemmatimonadales bacterium]|nr:DUF4917 family protein [Gemmatimonadales bacterium]